VHKRREKKRQKKEDKTGLLVTPKLEKSGATTGGAKVGEGGKEDVDNNAVITLMLVHLGVMSTRLCNIV
jgi:hypothetical protein